jgi:hypothetical protein
MSERPPARGVERPPCAWAPDTSSRCRSRWRGGPASGRVGGYPSLSGRVTPLRRFQRRLTAFPSDLGVVSCWGAAMAHTDRCGSYSPTRSFPKRPWRSSGSGRVKREGGPPAVQGGLHLPDPLRDCREANVVVERASRSRLRRAGGDAEQSHSSRTTVGSDRLAPAQRHAADGTIRRPAPPPRAVLRAPAMGPCGPNRRVAHQDSRCLGLPTSGALIGPEGRTDLAGDARRDERQRAGGGRRERQEEELAPHKSKNIARLPSEPARLRPDVGRKRAPVDPACTAACDSSNPPLGRGRPAEETGLPWSNGTTMT